MDCEGFGVVAHSGAGELVTDIAPLNFSGSVQHQGVEYLEGDIVLTAYFLGYTVEPVGEVVDKDRRKMEILPLLLLK